MRVNDYSVEVQKLGRAVNSATFYLEVIPIPERKNFLFSVDESHSFDFFAEKLPGWLPCGNTVSVLWPGTLTVVIHGIAPNKAIHLARHLRSFISSTYCTNVAIGVADAGDGLAEGLYRAERACYEARLDDSPNVRGWHPSMSGVTPSANWTFQHPPTIFPPVLMNWPKSSHQLIQSEVCE